MRLLIALADEIRELPVGTPQHQAIADRFFAIIAHLEKRRLIAKGQWNL
jgi:hypothetical protein